METDLGGVPTMGTERSGSSRVGVRATQNVSWQSFLLVVGVLLAWSAGKLEAAEPSDSHAEQRGPFVLPTGKESIVHPYGRDVPEAVEAFLDEAGTDWLIVWDRRLDTPLFAAPATPFSAIEPPATLSEGEQASVA